jgi:hypothetical protein
LSYATAYNEFKKLLKNYGFDEKVFGLHSMRASGTTDAFDSKIPPHWIDLQGRWKSEKSKYNYVRVSFENRVKCIRRCQKY